MRTPMRGLLIGVMLGFMLVGLAPAQQGTQAQQSGETTEIAPAPPAGHEQAGHRHHGGSDDVRGREEKHERWKAHHEQMMAELEAMDARLTEKVAAMNAATGDAKMEAMAAVINELVAQRKILQERMRSRHDHQAGMSPRGGTKGGMQCGIPYHQGDPDDQ